MTSIIEGYNYEILISYPQKKNEWENGRKGELERKSARQQDP